jgi:redox-sensitive bicupin YhaK (pirin superfamily)
MVVAAHPHTGLQTVTWLFEGEIEHRDSIGSNQAIRPGQLNLMTAGFGISHSELSLATTDSLHAVQLWIALPEESLNIAPSFEHHVELPVVTAAGFRATVLIGELLGIKSPATSFTDLVGAELIIEPGTHRIELRTDYEYGFVLIAGTAKAQGEDLAVSDLLYVARGESTIEISSSSGATLMLLGGVPLKEKIIMWWNFIGRSHQDVVDAREAWNTRSYRFGEFEDQIGGWIPAPELPGVTLQAR